MKTAGYILGILVFSALVIKTEKKPELKPSTEYVKKERENSLREKCIDEKIVEIEANIAINEAKIEIQSNNVKVNKK